MPPSLTAPPRSRSAALAPALLLVAWLGVPAAYLVVPVLVRSVVYDVTAVAAAACVVWGVRRHRPPRPAPWYCLAAGILTMAAGDIVFALLSHQPGGAPFPSAADAVYLASYLPFFAAMSMLVRRAGTRDAVAWVDSVIWTVGAMVLSWQWLLRPNMGGDDVSLLAQVVALAYPMADLGLVLFLVRLLAARTARSTSYRLLIAAFCLQVVADCAYGLTSLAGTYDAGDPLDLLWLFFYAGCAAAALHPSMTRVAEPVAATSRTGSRARLLALAVPGLACPALLALQVLQYGQVDGLLIAGAAALLLLLTGARAMLLVGEIERLATDLRQQATHDSLTGLPNRALFGDRLAARAAQPAGDGFLVAFVDLDAFKSINDTLGHHAGDDLLVQVAGRLRGAAGPGDVVARLGGDEFAVLTEDTGLPERLLAAMEEPFTLEGLQLRVSASVGHVAAGADGDPAELLRAADLAMYAAKRAGGGRARATTSAELPRTGPLQGTAQALADALADGRVEVHARTLHRLDDGAVVAVEALPRWRQADGTLLLPERWLPDAERAGLALAVDLHVLRTAATAVADRDDDLVLAVPVSPGSLSDPGFADAVVRESLRAGLPPGRLVLGLAGHDTALATDSGRTQLDLLRRQGVRLGLDGFGTGTSLRHLQELPVDVLGLDPSCAATLERPRTTAVVHAVAQLAVACGLEAFADGIATADQRHALLAAGFRTGTGPLYGAPVLLCGLPAAAPAT